VKLIALPDLHETGIKYLPLISEQLADADCVILVGDLTNGGRETEVANVVQTVKTFNPAVLAVPGNWDRKEANDYLSSIGINLHCQHQIIDDIAFVGVGGALLSIGQTPTEYSEKLFNDYLMEAITGLDAQLPIILVSHQPPYNTLVDTAYGDIHLGSHSVRTFIERIQPVLCLTGHIHEAVGVDRVGLTKIINPGPLWQGGYGFIELNSSEVDTIEIRKCAL
jgi:Icc-related predicted phosphoesterase